MSHRPEAVAEAPGGQDNDAPVEAGAVVECGGKVGDDGVVAPTVLSGVTPDMKVSCAEVFGPVVGVATYTDFEDALASANDTIYGLHAAVFTSDINKALRAAKMLDFGGCARQRGAHLAGRSDALRGNPRVG